MRSTAPPHGSAALPRHEIVLLVAPLWSRRVWSAGIFLVALLQLLAVQRGFSGLGCPFHEFTGVPCPGCGLTTAILQICRADWKAGIASHAFAPIFMLGIAGSFFMAVLPTATRDRLLHMVERSERSGLVAAVGACLLVYWIVRVTAGHLGAVPFLAS